jgi:putative ABC transport system permease protein
MDAFKIELKKNPNIKGVATSSSLIGFGGEKAVHLFESDEGMAQYALNFNVVDFDYIDVMEMDILKGRKFNREIPCDTANSFIVNQAAAAKFNWGDNSLGKKLQLGVEIEGVEDHGEVQLGEVIGVIRDFNYQPLKDLIEPMNLVVSENPAYRRNLHVKINSKNRNETIAYIEKVWNEFCPNMSFGYFFLDDRMKENYEPEERLTWIFSIFSLISILIASMGLFGLSSFMAEQRNKELGIRKVLGAPVVKLVYLLTGEFIRLILFANLIAVPISYWALSAWLNDFPYRISIGIWVFVATLIISLVIGLFTVAWQSFRAANADPIKAIKYE